MTPTLHSSPTDTSLNLLQQQAVKHPIEQGLHVIAGAGTGKTTVISHRYAHIYKTLQQQKSPNPASQILTLTFTVKAAEEMAQRIQQQLTQQKISPSFDTNTAYINNFHGFGQHILRQHGERIGIPQTFSILDTAEQEQTTQTLLQQLAQPNQHPDIQQTITHALIAAGVADVILPDALNPDWIHEQITEMPTHEVLNALPTLIDRIKSAGLSPKQLYTLAQQQHDQLLGMLQSFPGNRFGGTENPHSQTNEALTDNESMASIWDNHTEAWQHAQNTLRGHNHGADEKMLKEQLKWLNDDWKVMVNGVPLRPLPRISRGKVDPGDERAWKRILDQFAHHRCLIDTVTAFYAVYQFYIHQRSQCDFNDLILRALEVLDTCPDILNHYQQQFRHIIVDEFQDTNDSQLKLIQRLLGQHGSHVTVVGDEKQSIYGFRFAQPENLHRLAESLPHVTHLTLKSNYRCQPAILDVANAYTQHTLNKPQQTLTAGANPTPDAPFPVVEWIDLMPDNAHDDSPKQTSPPDKTSILAYQEAEAHWMAQRIQQLTLTTPFTYNDMVILVPTHTKASRISEILSESGIPSSLEKGFALFMHPETLILQAWMRWLQAPNHSEALVRILQEKLTDAQLRQLCALRGPRNAQQPSLVSVWQSKAGKDLIQQWPQGLQNALSDLWETHQTTRYRLRQEPLVTVLQDSAEQLGFTSELHMAAPLFLQWIEAHLKREKRYLTLGQVNQRIQSWQRLNNTVLEHTQQRSESSAQTNPTQQSVRILTIHASKGLEFPVVFVSGVYESTYRSPLSEPIGFEPQFKPHPGFGLFLTKTPLIDGSSNHNTHSLPKRLADNLWCRPRFTDEQQRLFYVAITRAKRHLFVIRHPKAPAWTDLTPLIPYLTTQHSVTGEGPIQQTVLPIHQVPLMQPLHNSETTYPRDLSSQKSLNPQPAFTPNTPDYSKAHEASPTPSYSPQALALLERCPIAFQLSLVGVNSKSTQLNSSHWQDTDLVEQANQLAQHDSLIERPPHIDCPAIQCGYHHCCPRFSTSPSTPYNTPSL